MILRDYTHAMDHVSKDFWEDGVEKTLGYKVKGVMVLRFVVCKHLGDVGVDCDLVFNDLLRLKFRGETMWRSNKATVTNTAWFSIKTFHLRLPWDICPRVGPRVLDSH